MILLHKITIEDLMLNPGLEKEVKVGETVELPVGDLTVQELLDISNMDNFEIKND